MKGSPVPEKKIWVVFATKVGSKGLHSDKISKKKLIKMLGCPARVTASNNIKISRRTFELSDLASYTIHKGKPMLF